MRGTRAKQIRKSIFKIYIESDRSVPYRALYKAAKKEYTKTKFKQ